MKKGELIKLLEPYSDDTVVKITYSCDNDYRNITDVGVHPRNGSLILESREMPDENDIQIIAENYYEFANGDVSTNFEWFLFGKSTEEREKEWNAYVDSLRKRGLAT